MDDPLLTAYALGELKDEAAIAQIEARIDREPELVAEVELIRMLGTEITDAFNIEKSVSEKEEAATEDRIISFDTRKGKDRDRMRQAKIARLSESAPELKTNRKMSYGSLIAALVATVALAGIFSFNQFSESLEGAKGKSQTVRVEPLGEEEESIEAVTLAESIEQEIAEENAKSKAQFDAMTESIAGTHELSLNSDLAASTSIEPVDRPGLIRIQVQGKGDSTVLEDVRGLLDTDSVASGNVPSKEESSVVKTGTGSHVVVPSLARDFQEATKNALTNASHQLGKKERTQADEYLPFYIQTGSFAAIEESMKKGETPNPSEIRIEELVNRFSFGTPFSEDKDRFKINFEVVQAPWNTRHDLMRITVRGSDLDWSKRPKTHLVLVVDTGETMAASDRSPIVKAGLGQLIRRLDERDVVTLIVAGEQSRVILKGVRGDAQEKLLSAIEGIAPEKAEEMNLAEALEMALGTRIEGVSSNYVICLDGNVKKAGWKNALEVVENGAGVEERMNVFRFGRNRDSDGLFDRLAEMGHGQFEGIETIDGANRRFVEVASRAISVIAENFKMELSLNGSLVRGYRLIGFDDDRLASRLGIASNTVGSGHSLTMLYELIPNHPVVEYREELPAHFTPVKEPFAASDHDYVRVKVGYDEPEKEGRQHQEFAYAVGRVTDWDSASEDMRWSSSVAAFGLILREGKVGGVEGMEMVRQWAQAALGSDATGERQRFLELVQRME